MLSYISSIVLYPVFFGIVKKCVGSYLSRRSIKQHVTVRNWSDIDFFKSSGWKGVNTSLLKCWLSNCWPPVKEWNFSNRLWVQHHLTRSTILSDRSARESPFIFLYFFKQHPEAIVTDEEQKGEEYTRIEERCQWCDTGLAFAIYRSFAAFNSQSWMFCSQLQ